MLSTNKMNSLSSTGAIAVHVELMDHFDREFPLPAYETLLSAGADIRVCFADKKSITLEAGERQALSTGLKMEIPPGYEIQVRPRSGLSLKTSLMVLNSPGTIDADYRGEIKILMGNLGSLPIEINHGDRVAQLVLSPIIQAQFVISQSLSSTQRGEGGFGSTGVN
jgi:dUTP pyrophosphatase